MNYFQFAVVFVVLLVGLGGFAIADKFKEQEAVKSSSMVSNSATTPTSRLNLKWWKQRHLKKVKEVKTTSRLTSSPSCVVKDASDPMAGMAAMFAQMGQEMPETPLILEINPEHEMIKKLDTLEDKVLFEDLSWILLDSAKLSEGLEPKDKGAFALRVASLATKAI